MKIRQIATACLALVLVAGVAQASSYRIDYWNGSSLGAARPSDVGAGPVVVEDIYLENIPHNPVLIRGVAAPGMLDLHLESRKPNGGGDNATIAEVTAAFEMTDLVFIDSENPDAEGTATVRLSLLFDAGIDFPVMADRAEDCLLTLKVEMDGDERTGSYKYRYADGGLTEDANHAFADSYGGFPGHPSWTIRPEFEVPLGQSVTLRMSLGMRNDIETGGSGHIDAQASFRFDQPAIFTAGITANTGARDVAVNSVAFSGSPPQGQRSDNAQHGAAEYRPGKPRAGRLSG